MKNNNCFPWTRDGESKVFFLKMIGNYYRFAVNSAKKLWLTKNYRWSMQILSTDYWSLRFLQLQGWCFQHELGCWQYELGCNSVLFFQCNIIQNYIQADVTNINVDFGNIFPALQLQQVKTCEVNSPTVMNPQEHYHASFLCSLFRLAIAHKILHFSFSFCYLGSFI